MKMKNEHFVHHFYCEGLFLLKGATKGNQGGIPSLQAELEWTGYIQITEQINNNEEKTRKCFKHNNCTKTVSEGCQNNAVKVFSTQNVWLCWQKVYISHK